MKRPSFQFYAGDWLGSMKISLMTPEQEGAYIHLLCHMWGQDDCSLPNDDEALSRLSRLHEKWEQCKEIILKCFEEKNGKIFNKRLLIEKRSRMNSVRSRLITALRVVDQKRLGFFWLNPNRSQKSSSSSSSSSINSLLSKQQIFDFLRKAADQRIPNETIDYQADELIKKYNGTPVRNLKALCNEWASNIEVPVKKLIL